MTEAVEKPGGAVLREICLSSEEQPELRDVYAIAQGKACRITIPPETVQVMQKSCVVLEKCGAKPGAQIYGTTTGFGPHVRFSVSRSADVELGEHLFEHLHAGYGTLASREVVRATIYLRLLALCRGCSAVRPEILLDYGVLLEEPEYYPAVPLSGSVGASGDLVPLAHIAMALAGRGEFTADGQTLESARVFTQRDWRKAVRPLRAREALAFTNGVSFSCAQAILAQVVAEHLLAQAERFSAWLYAILGAQVQALAPAVHTARGHAGQIESAAYIRVELERLHAEAVCYSSVQTHRSLQEIYSLRCAPQILGACRTQIQLAGQILRAEISGTSDNPVVVEGEIYHGGNFFGQQIAFAADMINSAVTQIGLLAERQIALALEPGQNGDAPLLLAHTPGLDSGLAGAQLTATALAAEMRANAGPHANGTIPTNGTNQDIVSMAAYAARSAYAQMERLAAIEAVLVIALDRLQNMCSPRDQKARQFRPKDLPNLPHWTRDRALSGHLHSLAMQLLRPAIREAKS